MKKTSKKIRITVSLSEDLAQELSEFANTLYGGNVSLATTSILAKELLHEELKVGTGPHRRLLEQLAILNERVQSLEKMTRSISNRSHGGGRPALHSMAVETTAEEEAEFERLTRPRARRK